MPIYGYTCQSCGHHHDELQKIADDPLVVCPECGEPALKRQLSAPKFRLKGKGWYETDFKTGDKRNLHGDDKASAPKEKKSDKKPASDNDKKPASDNKASSA
jgi:putative FmdB family regulatory protein